MLPAVAIVLLGLLAAWPRLIETADTVALVVDRGRNEVVNAKFFGRDTGNQPYSVTSETAVQRQDHPDLVDMAKPSAEFTQRTGLWVTLSADRGIYHQESGHLEMYDTVHVLRDDGLEFTTAQALVDTKAGTAEGDRPVTGQSPTGEIDAQGFRIHDFGNTVVFLLQSRATLSGADPAGRR